METGHRQRRCGRNRFFGVEAGSAAATRREGLTAGKLRFSRHARADLLSIWSRIAGVNPAAADRVFDRIEARCAELKVFPEIGPPRPEIGRGARMLVIDRWLAFYRLTDDGVQVVRIVDGVRDLRHLGWPAG